MITLTTEQAQQIEEALLKYILYCDCMDYEHAEPALATIRAARAQEQAEQEPVAIIEKEAGFETEVYATGHAASLPDGVFKLYAAPVRTKDLTAEMLDALIAMVSAQHAGPITGEMYSAWKKCRAVIAADREKNRG